MTWVKWKNLDLDVIVEKDEVVFVFYSCPMDTEANILQVLINLNVDINELKMLALKKNNVKFKK
jgi:hypothetical protein